MQRNASHALDEEPRDREPNAETQEAMREAEEILRNRAAHFMSAEELFRSLES